MRPTFSRVYTFLAMLPVVALVSTNPVHAADTITHQIALPSGMTWCDDSMINGLLAQVNGFRSQKGLAPLSMSALGMKDAEIRATQFASYMATNPPGSPGFNPHQGWDTTAAGLGYNIIGENLAYMTTDPAYIVYAAWQDPLHIAAMLAADANVAGVSCLYYNGTAYWTYEPGACSGASCGQTAPPPGPVNPPAPPPSGSPTLDSEEWAFLTLINNYRSANGLGPLQVSVMLETAARWMSNDMATKNYASHTDSLGRSTGVRLAAFGYTYSPWGENLAGGYADAQTAFDQWVGACDPDAAGTCTYAHRKTMLAAGFNVIGIARTYNGASNYGWYWVTDFGGYADQIITPSGSTPSAPTITSFSAAPSTITAGQAAVLNWSVSGAATIRIDNGVGDVSTLSSKAVSPAGTTTYLLTASNAAGSATARVTVTVTAVGDIQPPIAPTLKSAVAASATRVDLAWTASTDAAGVAGYQILRNGSVLTSVSGLTYSDTSAKPGTQYAYAVKAYDAAGNYSSASNSVQVTTPPVAVPGTVCPGPASGAFSGCYYNNTSLTGDPAFVRTDSQVNFDWGAGSPDPSVTPGNFSARWQGYFTFSPGTYTFSALMSDGMRIYIDGSLVLDRWRDQPASQYRIQRTLSQGSHLVAVEYYQRSGWATAHLSWQNSTAAVQPPAILSFTANPNAILAGQASTLAWSVNGATTISIDNQVGDVSGLTSKSVAPVATATYTLTATNDAGSAAARATVTVTAVQDSQSPTAPVLISAQARTGGVYVSWAAGVDNVGIAGYQVIRNGSAVGSASGNALAYTDAGASPGTTYTYAIKAYDAAGNYSGASNSVQVTTPAAPPAGGCPGPATNAFTGCYYNNITLSGAPALVRTDDQINFDWNTGSPSPAVTPDSFSTRWQGTFNFDQAAVYTFYATTSDGMRVYIDSNLVLDRWRDQPAYMYTFRSTLSQGPHLITVEYYGHSGLPVAHLTWQKN